MKSESVEPQGWKFGTIIGGYQLIRKLICKLCIKKQMNTNDVSSIFMMSHHVPHPNSTESIESQGFLSRSHSIYSRFTIFLLDTLCRHIAWMMQPRDSD